jgi:hypothetical protein
VTGERRHAPYVAPAASFLPESSRPTARSAVSICPSFFAPLADRSRRERGRHRRSLGVRCSRQRPA